MPEKTPPRKSGRQLVIANPASGKKKVRLNDDASFLKKESFENALQASGMGIWEWNLVSNTLQWSDKVYSIFGFKKPYKGISPEKYRQFIHPDDTSFVNDRLDQLLSSRGEFRLKHRIVKLSGEVAVVALAGSVSYNNQGKAVSVLGTMWDVTNQKRSDARLQYLDDLFTNLSLATHELFISNDWDSVISSGLRRLGMATNVDRVYLFQNDKVKAGKVPTTSQRYEWSSTSATPQINNPELQHLSSSLVEPSWSILNQYKPYAQIVREMEQGSFRRILEDEDILSILLFPIFVRQKFWGFIGFDECKFERKWTDVEFAVLRSYSASISSALERNLSEEEKRTWKKRYQIFSDVSGQIIYNTTLSSGKTNWSGDLEKMLGYSALEMNRHHVWSDHIHSEDKEAVLNKLEDAKKHLKPYELQYRYKHKSGKFVDVHDRGFFISSATGKAGRMLGIMNNITERREAEDRFQNLIRNLSVGVMLYNSRQECIVCNNASCELLGLTENQLLGQRSHDAGWKVIKEDGSDLPYEEQAITIAATTKKYVSNQTIGICRPQSSDIKWLLVSAEPTLRLDGSLQHIVCTLSDISERKKHEQELEDSESRFRALQEASFGGIGLHDKGMIIDCNQGLCDMTGYSYRELLGMNGLLLIKEEYRDLVLQHIIDNNQEPYDLEGLRKDGSTYPLEILGKSMPYKGKTIRVTEFRDITERKKSEQKIYEQNAHLTAVADDLKRKNEQLEEFTQIVSHNLRSPVGNIMTLLELFESAATQQEKDEYFQLLKESGKKTLSTLQELNEVLKIKQARHVERQHLYFADIVESVHLMLHASILQSHAVINAHFNEAPDLYFPKIYLESIILNLISNAIKYASPNRRPVITLRSYKTDKKIFLECEDNGLGIDLARYKHQVFKMRKTFHQHPESRGIGLFLIKNQVEAMGGEIAVSSELDKGTCFTVIFSNFVPTHEPII